MGKKRVDESVANSFLGDILKHHMDYNTLLTQKMGFLIAVSAFILTISLTGFLNKGFIMVPSLLKLGVITASISASFCILICLSAERPDQIKKVKGVELLSATTLTESSKGKIGAELIETLKDKGKVLALYSEELLNLKKMINIKGKKYTVATFTLFGGILIATTFGAVQLYITIF